MSRQDFPELREGVRQVVSAFDSRYWQDVDEARAFPEKFVTALTEAGWLSALIPEEYGGSNLSLTEASVIMEEINRAGGQLRCLPRANVCDGLRGAPWLEGTKRSLVAQDCFG